ncbi:MAG: hypothetical protein V3V25_02005 [Paracoccaceae bacterium]
MQTKHPLFVAQDGYRLRRAKDAARLLPVLGAILILMPILWGGGATRLGIVFVFAVWSGLIIGAFFLSRRLKNSDANPAKDTSTGAGNGPV